MSHNTFQTNRVLQQDPYRHPAPPTGPIGRGPRRWRPLAAGAAAGAVVATAVAALITSQARTTTAQPQTPAAVTVTVPAPTPSAPTTATAAPLPTAQADRQTCRDGWIPAGLLIDKTNVELDSLPKGMKLDDPAIAANAEWSAAVARAAGFQRQAAAALDNQIAPGTTPILEQAAHTAVNALRLTADSISPPNEIRGNAGEISNAAAAQVGHLCERLAP